MTSIPKLLLGLYISVILAQEFEVGLYLSPLLILVIPLKPPDRVHESVVSDHPDARPSIAHRRDHRPLPGHRIEALGRAQTLLAVEPTSDVHLACKGWQNVIIMMAVVFIIVIFSVADPEGEIGQLHPPQYRGNFPWDFHPRTPSFAPKIRDPHLIVIIDHHFRRHRRHRTCWSRFKKV